MKKEVILTYVGNDSWNRPTYEFGNTNRYVKDIRTSSKPIFYWAKPINEIDGEPSIPFICEESELIIITDPTQTNYHLRLSSGQEAQNALERVKEHGINYYNEDFRYQLLSRLQMDCDYYLGFGNHDTKQLWASTEKDHIEIMKDLFNSFPDDKKPEWITMENIQKYECRMLSYNEEKESDLGSMEVVDNDDYDLDR